MNYGRLFSGRILWSLLTLLMVLAALWLLRYPLLRASGNFLMSNDPELNSKAIYVLGGASLDRGRAAKLALDNGVAPKAYCLGENIPSSLEAEGIFITEGQLTANVMLRAGADPGRVNVIPRSTSTWEESLEILDHAIQQNYDTITVITTDLHSRRVGMVFRKPFRDRGITVLVRGAPSSRYDHQRWWEVEEGLLMVNNEYVKLIYYIINY